MTAAVEQTSYLKLPTEERCVHKVWKARISGYEEAVKLFGQLGDKDNEWNKFTEIIKKFVIDSNAIAQEKGLEATLAFVENSTTAGRTAGDVMAGLIAKCYGAPKSKTKDIAIQITLMFIEIEKQDVVIEELVKGMDHKFPKIVSTCIKASTQAIKEYGSKVFNIKPLLKKLQSILEDRDKTVRDEAKLLAIEIYSWIGPTPIKTVLSNLKPLQMQELEEEFEKVSGVKPQPIRFLRSQQATDTDTVNEDVVLEEGIVEVDDIGEHIDPVNILCQLNKDFYEKLEAKKWQERKEALDMLEGILSKTLKIENGEYGDLVRALKKIIAKDSNVIIVGVAAKCITLLANKLKKQFETYASACIPTLLEKFKEKKQNIVLLLRDAVDAIYLSMTLESIHEDILVAIDSKNPSVKAESISFLARCFTKCTPVILNKKMLKIFTIALVKTLNQSDPIVRDNSAVALGTAWKVVSEKNIVPFLGTVDALKLCKIKEASESAIIIPVQSTVVKKPISVSTNNVEKKAIATTNKNIALKKNIKTAINSKTKNPPGVHRKLSNGHLPNESEKEISDDELKDLRVRGKIIKGSIESASDDEKPDNEVNIQYVVARIDITPQLTDTLINEFADRDWKVRSNALNKLKNIVTEAKFITSSLGEVREALQDRISDSNARIGSNAINLVELITIAMGSSFKTYIRGYLPGVLNALGDSKTFKSQSARQCMNTVGDICGYREFFGGDILLEAFKNNSVTLRSELWTWLAEKLPIIPTKTIPADELKCLLPVLYPSLEDKSASVRSASEKAILGFMMHLGYASMYSACEKLKPMSVKFCRDKLDNERPNLPIEKPKVVKPCVPAGSLVKSKGSKILASKAVTKVHKENIIVRVHTATGKNKEEVDNKSLFQQNNLKHQRDIDEHRLKSLKWNFDTPREEFVEQLREQMLTANINKVLITNMFHSDFRYHLKAIESLSEDFNTADDNYLPLINNLDLILKWITLRFFDTNPSVLLKGLEYLQHIFNILITQKYTLHDTEGSSFVPYLVKKLGDPKDTVRNNVRTILKQIAFVFPTSKIFNYIMEGIKSKNSRQRSECLDHLTSMVEDYGTSVFQPSIPVACKEIAKSIGDRDNSVRTAALNCFVAAFFLHGEALLNFVGHISEKDMGLLKERLKRASKNRVVPVATIHPTMKIVVPPIQHVPDIEEDVADGEYTSDCEENNVILNVSQESNLEQNPQGNENNSPSSSENSSLCTSEAILSALEHSLSSEMEFRLSKLEIADKTKVTRTRFTLDEKFIQELESEVIKTPQLVLTPYNWTVDHGEIKFGKILQDNSQCLFPDGLSLLKPSLNVNPSYSTETTVICKNPTNSIHSITQLINQVTSMNIEILKVAFIKFEKILTSPDTRSKLIENGNVLSLFHGIIRQFDELSKCHNTTITDRYKNIFHLCLNVFKYQEIMLILPEQIVRDLFSKLLSLLNSKEIDSSSELQLFKQCVNSLIVNILELCDHTTVTCVLLTMLHDTVKNPQNSTSSYNELLMKCIWKSVKDFQAWGDGLSYGLVLEHIHNFLEEFDFKYWEKQPCDIPMKTCKTILYTMLQLRSDRVLECLTNLELPKHSAIVVFIHKALRNFNRRSETKNDPRRAPRDELSDIFKLIGQHEMMDEAVQQLYKFKISHPDIDIEPHVSKTTKYFQDCIHRRLSAIEDNFKSCPVKHDGNVDCFKSPEKSAAPSEADCFMKRLQMLKRKASVAAYSDVLDGKRNNNNLLDREA